MLMTFDGESPSGTENGFKTDNLTHGIIGIHRITSPWVAHSSGCYHHPAGNNRDQDDGSEVSRAFAAAFLFMGSRRFCVTIAECSQEVSTSCNRGNDKH
jgi:hypothetical protein